MLLRDEILFDDCLQKTFNKIMLNQKEFNSDINLWKEADKMLKILQELTHKDPEVNRDDIIDALRWSFSNLSRVKKSAKQSEFDTFREEMKRRILGEPVEWNIFFRVGDLVDFKEGYEILNGRLYSHARLPKSLQNLIVRDLPHSQKKEQKWFEDKDHYDRRRLSEWYVCINTTAFGINKASERAINDLNKILAVMKFFRFFHIDTSQQLFLTSPYNFAVLKNSKVVMTMDYNRDHRDLISHIKPFDTFISKINALKFTNNSNMLANRILDSIVIFGNIDRNIPISLRFILCIIALERLLVDTNEQMSKRSVLAERIAYLIGDTKGWFLYYYGIDTKSGYEIRSKFRKENLKGARQALYKKMLKLYDKRSEFAHTGITAQNIQNENYSEDYQLASSLLEGVVEKLLTLQDKGITRIDSKYTSILNWDMVPTDQVSLSKFSELHEIIESVINQNIHENAKISRDEEKNLITITGINSRTMIIVQTHDLRALLIEYDGIPDESRGRCLFHFYLRKENKRTYLVLPEDNNSLKEFINKIKFGKSKTDWDH